MEGECLKRLDRRDCQRWWKKEKDGHNCEGQLGSRKGTEDPGETEASSPLAWWRLEDKGKDRCFPR